MNKKKKNKKKRTFTQFWCTAGFENSINILHLNATGNVRIGLDFLKRSTKYTHFWDPSNIAGEGTCTTASWSASRTAPRLDGCHCKGSLYYAQGIQTKAMPRCLPPTVKPDHCAIWSPRLLLSIQLLHKFTHTTPLPCLLHCNTHCQICVVYSLPFPPLS